MSIPPLPSRVTQSVPSPDAERVERIRVQAWSVEVVGGVDRGRKVTTQDDLVRVGGDPGADLVLSDPTVSRRHLELERDARGFSVRDLGSRNGTFVDGRQVWHALLRAGDVLTLGQTQLCVSLGPGSTEVELAGAEAFGQLVGRSERMRLVFALLRRFAREDVPLLLEGETGTGKELAARAVHAHSARAEGPFRVVDCHRFDDAGGERDLLSGDGALGLPEGGAGARGGGTLFLDEVGELPLALQPRLLRFLGAHEQPPPPPAVVGPGVLAAAEPAAPEAPAWRVIASTQHNLEEDVRQGRFRADLYFRLAVARVRLPPLRARREDLALLASVLLQARRAPFTLTPQTLALFESYDWPGNVRELRNVLERGALMEETGSGSWLDFLPAPLGARKGAPLASVGALVTGMPYHEARDRVLADFERYYFTEVMRAAGFDMDEAEKRTGLSMQSLYRLLKKNGLRLKDLKNAQGA